MKLMLGIIAILTTADAVSTYITTLINSLSHGKVILILKIVFLHIIVTNNTVVITENVVKYAPGDLIGDIG